MGMSDFKISQRWSAGRAAITSSTFSGIPKSVRAAAAWARRLGATPELRRASSILAGPFCVPCHCSIFSELTLSQAATATSPSTIIKMETLKGFPCPSAPHPHHLPARFARPRAMVRRRLSRRASHATSKVPMAKDVIHPPIFGSSCLRERPIVCGRRPPARAKLPG